jgi:hypothetical protein
MKWLLKVRKVLGAITDVLLVGRLQGWWSKKDAPKWKR